MTTLKPVEPVALLVDQEILKDAEEFLEDVRKGHVAAFALVWRTPDGYNTSVFKTGSKGYSLVGLLQSVQNRILAYMESD